MLGKLLGVLLGVRLRVLLLLLLLRRRRVERLLMIRGVGARADVGAVIWSEAVVHAEATVTFRGRPRHMLLLLLLLLHRGRHGVVVHERDLVQCRVRVIGVGLGEENRLKVTARGQ